MACVEVGNWMPEKPEYKTVRIGEDAWLKLKKATVEYDFGIDELLNWIILELNQDELNEYAKDLDVRAELEEEEKHEEAAESEEAEEDELEEEEKEEEGEEVKKY